MSSNLFRGLRIWSKAPPNITITQPTRFIQRPVLHEGWTPEWRQECIEELKFLLVEKGFLKTTGGDFDRDTKLAVKNFQRANNLEADGFVGQITWAALLFPILKRTDTILPETADKVKELQRKLWEERLNVEIDGFFGPETERAVKEFQRRYKVRDDGICGYLTWSLLMGQKTEWMPQRKFLFLSWSLVEQLLTVAAVAAGIHVAAKIPIEPPEETVALPLVSLFVVAYGLSCVSQPIFSKLPIDRMTDSGLPLMRFAPYVLTGFFWRAILGRLLQTLLSTT